MKLVLASSSPFRAAILRNLALPFTAVSPEVDESRLPGESPQALVERLAVAKAHAVAADADTFVIGSDQVATLGGEVLGKPHTVENAVSQLSRFSGREVRFLTGLWCGFARSLRRRFARMWRWSRRCSVRAVSSRKAWAFCCLRRWRGAIRMPW